RHRSSKWDWYSHTALRRTNLRSPLIRRIVSVPMNHLEQLTAEWYEFRGYFVRRNGQVGRRDKGGYECGLDVVPFCPKRQHVVHVEPSMGANTWAVREARYTKKFEAGRKHIPGLFKGISLPSD